jgi:hypothetical protein
MQMILSHDQLCLVHRVLCDEREWGWESANPPHAAEAQCSLAPRFCVGKSKFQNSESRKDGASGKHESQAREAQLAPPQAGAPTDRSTSVGWRWLVKRHF